MFSIVVIPDTQDALGPPTPTPATPCSSTTSTSATGADHDRAREAEDGLKNQSSGFAYCQFLIRW